MWHICDGLNVILFLTTKIKVILGGMKKMVVGQIINCCTVDEVIRKAFELKTQGIITEFVENNALRVVAVG